MLFELAECKNNDAKNGRIRIACIEARRLNLAVVNSLVKINASRPVITLKINKMIAI